MNSPGLPTHGCGPDPANQVSCAYLSIGFGPLDIGAGDMCTMPLLAPPETPEPWFEVAVDPARGLIRLSFDRDTYVRFFRRSDLIALVVELDAALEELGPEPTRD